ncbi:hypothetical protein ACTG16_23545 [Aeromonas sp. 23P]|uniref:hypothetical protein n=1 Tax=Aeromonas sp. 23P TaxID=3452716 RepID=UPI003F7AF13D|nr:hypothetical protein [Aeromonas veronii]
MSSVQEAVRDQRWRSFCLNAIALGVSVIAIAVTVLVRQGDGGITHPLLVVLQMIELVLAGIFAMATVWGLIKFVLFPATAEGESSRPREG